LSELLTILLPLLIGLIVFLAVMRGVMSLMRRKLGKQIRAKLAGRTIIRESIGANFFGLSSKGLAQVRGNGALVLTPDQLYFAMFVPRRELTIPLADIVSVSTPRSHLGKTVGMKLLRVDFRVPAGQDSVAWAVRDLDDWKADIERHMPH
jgi:hypothetical protein